MGKVEDSKKLEEKKKAGKELLECLLEKNNKTVDEMYEIFDKRFNNFKIYGNTKEKALLNYCTFKNDIVEREFNLDRR